MSDSPFELPPDFSFEVRLFPLRDLVLFPGNLQPLHIFEPRYREMLEDALEGDQLITMATLHGDSETEHHGQPSLAATVCIGRVASHERNADGTYNLILVGLRRAVIERELAPERPFRRAVVRLLDDPEPEIVSVTSGPGHDLAIQLSQKLTATKEFVDQCLKNNIPLGAFTDTIAFHLPLDVEFKLELLAEPNALKRAEFLLTWLSEQRIASRPSGKFPPDFSAN